MAALTRKTQKIFGETAGVNQRGVIGSFAAGAPAYSTDPDTIQSLANYNQGWYGVVVGQNSPAIQDMNSLDFLITRQLAYLFERGVAEWDAATTYYTGSVASDSTGQIFVSLSDNNLNNALTDTSNWRLITGPNTVSINPATQSPYTLTAADRGKTFLVNTANGAMTFNLPAAFLNYQINIVDSAGSASINNITMVPQGGAAIQGTVGNYVIDYDNASTSFDSDGTNWFIIAGGRPVTRRSTVPAGTIIAYAGSGTPSGWAACDGSALSQTTYAQLFANISSTWNTAANPLTGASYSAPGAGTFRVPDLRGAFLRGAGGPNSAGVTTSLGAFQADTTAKNGLSNSTSTVTGSVSGTVGGINSANPTLAHSHSIDGSQFRWNAGASGGAIQCVDGNNSGTNGGGRVTNNNATNLDHTHSFSGSFSSGSAAAQTITGDGETRPDNQGIRYLIKLYNES